MKPYDQYYLDKRNKMKGAEFRTRIKGFIEPGMKIHVSAVCGKAMVSVACMLQALGYDVTGSDDVFNPPMSDVLKSHNIKCFASSAENLEGVDLVIIGNALFYNSLEVEEARRRKLPMISGAEAVAQILENKRSLVVAGTHGKTTTSGLLTHVFSKVDKEPAYLLGGVFQQSNSSFSLGDKDTKFAIYEGDEYNCAFFDQGPKFLHYNASSVILTSIEHDHIDLYPTYEDFIQAFQFLIEELPEDGFLVAHESALKHLDIAKCKAKVVTYGPSNSADVRYENLEVGPEGTIFNIGSESIFIPMFGEYNVANAAAVYALSLREGLPQNEVIKALANFPGTKERQELLGTTTNGIYVLKDYAHHPTAVGLTLDGLRSRFPGKRVFAVLELNSNSSRKKVFEEPYIKALETADVSIVITPPPKESDNKQNPIDPSHMKEVLEKAGKISYTAPDCNEALEIVKTASKPSDVVIFMSNGNMLDIPKRFLTD